LLSHIHRESQTTSLTAGSVRARLHDVRAGLGRALAGGGEPRARLRTLTLIRWIAIVGQAFTILLVHFSLGLELPLVPLLAAVALSALINLLLSVSFAPTTRLTERGAGLLLGYDVAQLAFLLALTGGLQNPFSVLLLVPVTLSATILSLRTTVVLCLEVIAIATLLGLFPTDLPWYGGVFRLPALYLLGFWIALVLGTALIAGYAWRVADEARRLSDALAATQMALAREQQLSALGGLAAAAAHELGSPLATIAVTAREIANSLPPGSPLTEDAAELVGQSQRCREILRSLGQRQADEDHRPFTRLPLSHLLETIAEPYRLPDIDLGIEVERAEAHGAEPRLAPSPELRHGLGNLVDNAMRFAEREVRIAVVLRPEQVELRIDDDGPGFSPEVLEFLGEPYLSTQHEAGGLGLGIFIAQTLLARTGARLQFDNLKRGARVSVSWPRAALEETASEM
jgi:two-component system, sensor histidine kinase RegB